MRRRLRTRKTAVLALVVALAVVATGAIAAALGGGRGPVVRTIVLAAHPGALTLDPAGRYAFLSTYTADPQTQTQTPGRTLVFDLRTGALAHAVAVGINPQATVVDAHRGRLIVAGDGVLAFVDARMGRATTVTTAASIFDPIIVYDRRGRFYGIDSGAGGISGGLDIFDARTGALLNRVTLQDGQELGSMQNASGLAFDEHAARLYVPYTTSIYGTRVMADHVAVLDPSGRVVHTATLGRFPAQGSSALSTLVDPARGRVVVIDGNTGDVSTLDARTGGLVFTLHLATAATMQSGIIAPAFGPYALDTRTGHVFLTLPRRQRCTFPRPSAGVSHGSCVPTGPAGRLYMLDTRTGRLLRRLLPGVDPGSITVDDRAGCVLAQSYPSLSTGGSLRVFDAATGALRWQVPLGSPVSGRYPVVDDATGRVYLVDHQGAIALLDTRTGRVTTSETVKEIAMADPRAGYVNVNIANGRVVVVRDNGMVAPPSDPPGWLPPVAHRWVPWRPARPRIIPGIVSIFDAPR